ncbi:MAG: DUF2085 domain-containing protein [Acidobacteria bacterium]|nr:DUF2085 domain-containing protein [Acidobacteriota bacterium]
MIFFEHNATKTVYLALLIISCTWLGLIFAAPWLISERHPMAAIIIYQGFSAVCHQQLERSYLINGLPLGVCSRCTGIYFGFLAGLLLFPAISGWKRVFIPKRRWLVIASIPLLIDFGVGLIGLIPNNFMSRTATGLLFGAVLAFYLLPGLISAYEMMMTNIKSAPNI